MRHWYGRLPIDKIITMLISFLFLFHFVLLYQLLVVMNLLLKVVFFGVVPALLNIHHILLLQHHLQFLLDLHHEIILL